MYKNPLWIGIGIQYTLAAAGLITFSSIDPEGFWSIFFAVWMLLNIITLIVFNIKEDDLDLS